MTKYIVHYYDIMYSQIDDQINLHYYDSISFNIDDQILYILYICGNVSTILVTLCFDLSCLEISAMTTQKFDLDLVKVFCYSNLI